MRLGSSAPNDMQEPASPVSVVRQDLNETILASIQVSGESVACPTPILLAVVTDPCCPVGNTHSMVTHAKAGIFKPKVFSTELQECEPRTIEEAFASLEWKKATQDEFDASIRNRTWELVPILFGTKVVGCKRLFKIKRNPNGIVARRKGQLVAKGCS